MQIARLISLGARAVGGGMRRKLQGPRRYDGSVEEICEQIVRSCYDPVKGYFTASRTSYRDFWARDFGRSVAALLSMGFENEVGDSFSYAFRQYERAGRFALIISPSGKVFDFPSYAPDGFAFFLLGLSQLDDAGLVRQNRMFLEREVARFFRVVVDPKTGLARAGVHFSEAQDYVVRSSSCYTNVMCYLVQRCLDRLGLTNPLADFDYPDLIVRRFWNGKTFRDDLGDSDSPSGDAAILPLWSGLLGNDERAAGRLDRVLDYLDRTGLVDPLPARYGVTRSSQRRMILIERFNQWQRDAVWTCLGLHLLETLRAFGHPRFAADLASYEDLVNRRGCFPEVLEPDQGDLFEGPFYTSEDSMLWAANLWRLVRDRGSVTSCRNHENFSVA